MIRQIQKLVAPLWRRVQLMIGRAVIRLAREEGGFLVVQATGLSGEVLDGVPVIQEYGFASRPQAGAQAVIACPGGNRRAAIVIATGDKRYRIPLAAGEASIHDDLGQKVHLARAGIVVESPLKIDATAPEVTVAAAVKVTLDTPLVEVTGAIAAAGNITALSGGVPIGMSEIKAAFNGHTHPGDSGGNTGAPSAAI